MDNLEELEKSIIEKAVIDKVEDSVVLSSTDNPEYRANAQMELSGKKVDIKEFQEQLKNIKEGTTPESVEEQLKKVQEELKNTQMMNEALKGILGQLCTFVEAFLPEIQKTAGNHQSFFQIQQMVMIGKNLAMQEMPEAVKKELSNAKANR